MFTHSASHRAALLFSHHFQTGVPTSYSTVLRWPGAHSLNCVKFAQRVFCVQAGMHVCAVWSCRRILCICSPYYFLHSAPMNCIHIIKLQEASEVRLIMIMSILFALSWEAISEHSLAFDIESNPRVDVRM